jgi:diadenosine tetraphosphatase ApaH/serine/threonine PP2A family protein phosphatase
MRALILSDIHGNLEALEAVLAAAGSFDVLWNLGDVVGYGASPNEVVERLRPLATMNVRGNHDKVCCGIDSANGFNVSARDAALWTKEQLTADSAAWLRTLPAGPIQAIKGVALSHGSPQNEDVYILTIRDAWVPLQGMSETLMFFGHTHVQGGFGWENGRWFETQPRHARGGAQSQSVLRIDAGRRYLLNPGSVGQPRDGDPRAAYAIYDDAAGTVTFHRQSYDIDLAQGRILLAGLPEKLAKRLADGR